MTQEHDAAESPRPEPSAEASTSAEQPAQEPAPTDEAEALCRDVERLKAEVEQQRERAEENLRGWQRCQADFSNYRRRQEQEREELVQFAEMRLVSDLLPTLDDLDRAWQTLPPELRHLTWVEGMNLIDQKLRGTLAAHGLTPIEALGQPFDPYSHEAVMRDEGEPSELTTVVAELQKGYKLHGRVIRPSLVRVGKPISEPPATEAEPES